MRRLHPRTDAVLKFIINLVFAVYNCVLGIATHSWWFITVGAYYILLSTMRLLAALSFAQNRKRENAVFIMHFTGWLLFVLAWVLSGIVYMTLKFDVSVKYHEIAMITIALYAFTKLTLAILGVINSKNSSAPQLKTLRSIAFTDAIVSIYSLQRSMLVSFEEMGAQDILLFNTLSGIGMCIIVILIGLNLIIERNFKHVKNQENQR